MFGGGVFQREVVSSIMLLHIIDLERLDYKANQNLGTWRWSTVIVYPVDKKYVPTQNCPISAICR